MSWFWGGRKDNDDEEDDYEDDDNDNDADEEDDEGEEEDEEEEEEDDGQQYEVNGDEEEGGRPGPHSLDTSDDDLVSVSINTDDEAVQKTNGQGSGHPARTPPPTTITAGRGGGIFSAFLGSGGGQSKQQEPPTETPVEQEPPQELEVTNITEDDEEEEEEERNAVDSSDDDRNNDAEKGQNTDFPWNIENGNNNTSKETHGTDEANSVVDQFRNTSNNTNDNNNTTRNNVVNPQEDEEDDDEQPGELVLQGAIPENIVGGGMRDRVHSTITQDGDFDDNDDNGRDGEEEDQTNMGGADETKFESSNAEVQEEDEEEEVVTTLQDNQSLMILAAEHDRADIINNVLAECSKNNSKDRNNDDVGDGEGGGEEGKITTATPMTREALLHGGLPPLHVAILYGSMNAINCLLRVGADPSVRPDLATIAPALVQSVPNAKLLQGVTAWELVFGTNTTDLSKNNINLHKNKNGGIGGLVNLAPDKKQAIQHAFAAEALRCIGSDEVERLEQLVKAGVPASLDLGGKSLAEWTVEMGATRCQELLRPKADDSNNKNAQEGDHREPKDSTKRTAVLDRQEYRQTQEGEESLSSLRNRLDELDSLVRALSTCLDNLAEEVSVCHGLLLMGGGASALAAHVKSLKLQRERKQEELMRVSEAWENSEDELAYWIREAGGAQAVASILSSPPAAGLVTASSESKQKMAATSPNSVSTLVSSNASNHLKKLSLRADDGNNDNNDNSLRCRQACQDQIAAREAQIRKLRVSITDLSEENARSLAEVERRGLTGGIQLVRNLRDEIRLVDFNLERAHEGEAACRSQIALVQAAVLQQQQQQEQQKANEAKEAMRSTNEQETLLDETPVQQQDHETLNNRHPTAEATTDQVHTNNKQRQESPNSPAQISELVEQQQNITPVVSAEDSLATAPQAMSMEGSSRPLVVVSSSSVPPSEEGGKDQKERTTNTTTESERIATGQSTAIALTQQGGRGYFPLGLWEILLRIIGLGGGGGASSTAAAAMIQGSTALNHMIIGNGNRDRTRPSSHPPQSSKKKNTGPPSRNRQPAVII